MSKFKKHAKHVKYVMYAFIYIKSENTTIDLSVKWDYR